MEPLLIFTDAAFSQSGHASWGVVIATADSFEVRSAAFSDRLASSVEAEAKALANGLFLAAKAVLERPDAISELVVYSDCEGVVKFVRGEAAPRRRSAKEQVNPALEEVHRQLKRLEGITVTFRWCRGHNGDNRPRVAELNAIADQAAGNAHPHFTARKRAKAAQKKRNRQNRKNRARKASLARACEAREERS